jgi:CheY-like chemotaxis protein
VADSKTLKLLLVEDDLEDEQLISEALIEIEEQRRWNNWRTSSIVHVEQLADALDCLRQERFDAVLLNLSLPDSTALLDSFFAVNACTQGAPVIVLADEEDENLAHRLLREGAQDVLLKPELDCAPLARSLRYAVERQRRMKALQAAPFLDDLTGTLTHQGFLTIAGHYEQLFLQSKTSMVMAWFEVSDLIEKTQQDRDARESVLIRTGEVLRDLFELPSLVGRAGQLRFGVIASGFTRTATETLLHVAARRVQEAAWANGQHAATARFALAAPGASVEEFSCESLDETHRAAKTVMLAD